MTVLLPVAQRPKRLLLNSTIDAGTGRSVDTLSRYDDSWLEALNLLSRTKAHVDELVLSGMPGTEQLHPVKADEEFPLVLFFATLAFQNPEALAKRVAHWAEGKFIPFGPRRPLTGANLARWIQEQGDFFLSGVGGHLAARLRPLIGELQRSNLYVSPLTRRSALDCFGSIPSLALHAIRDFLKLIYNLTPYWSEDDQAEPTGHVFFADGLLEDAEDFAETAYHLFLDGVVLAEEKLSDHKGWLESDAGAALNDALDAWWAYTQLDIELGVPFNVTITETLPLVTPPWPERPINRVSRKLGEWKRTCYRTGHFYPLALKDAQSVHVEVEIPNPELRTPELKTDGEDSPMPQRESGEPQRILRHPWRSIRRCGAWARRATEHVPVSLIARFPDRDKGELNYPTHFGTAFGTYWRPSDRLLHFYSNRQLHEGTDRDYLASYLNLFVPLRFMPSVFLGYAGAIFAYLLAATFVAGSLVQAMIDDARPALLPEVVAVGALAVSLSLWLTGNLSQQPIVNQKLVVARHLLELSVGIILAAFLAFLCYLAASGFTLPPRGANESLVAPTVQLVAVLRALATALARIFRVVPRVLRAG